MLPDDYELLDGSRPDIKMSFIVDDKYYLDFTFETNITSYPKYYPGSWDEPSYGDSGEWEIVGPGKLIVGNSESGNEIYNGVDFTNFLKSHFGNDKSVEQLIYDALDESYQDRMGEGMDDDQEPEDYEPNYN